MSLPCANGAPWARVGQAKQHWSAPWQGLLGRGSRDPGALGPDADVGGWGSGQGRDTSGASGSLRFGELRAWGWARAGEWLGD